VKSLMKAVGLPAGDLRRPLSGLKPDHLARGVEIARKLGLDRQYGWRLPGSLSIAAE
jgi:4-hydroxy-tetrahydrodipicolinate synthase